MINIPNETLPIATQYIIANSLPSDEASIRNVFLIYCPKTQSKGTGFLLSNGVITSNEHVVRGAIDNEIIAISSNGGQYRIKKSIRDQKRDLVILVTEETLQGGLELDHSKAQTRQVVHTWGFPLMHNGPALVALDWLCPGLQHTPQNVESVASLLTEHY